MRLVLLAAFLFLGPFIRADEVTPAMELAFMAKLKTAVEHKDPALFADLMDFARTPDRKRILFVTSWEPFPSILSDRPRSYAFKRVTPPLSQGNGTSIRTFDDPLQDANRD